ncbi:MAG: iron ABC transporter permease [Rhodospirillaceae bacterium]|nr:iron ABC transporter permease [Rhodospirillaceae bacterium]MYB12400.1 iron ABC transporter permease [Rhodospirillaceae bacterium]MYI49172.1 iron ABC transporter permease [Rhodospirillaceae bacterium]
MPARRIAGGEALWLAALVVFVGIIAVLPIVRLLWEGTGPFFLGNDSPAVEVLSDPTTWRATRRSFETAVGGALLSLVLGTLFALLVALTDLRGKLLLTFCFMIPLMIPPQVTALSWIQVFGASSTLLTMLDLAPAPGSKHPLYSREGIVLLLGIQHAPLVFLTVRAGLRSLPREAVEAARMAGAGTLTVFRTIILPLMTPTLTVGVALAFVSSIGNFGIPLFLGQPAGYQTLPVLIFSRLSGFGPSIISEVAVLAILVSAIAALGVSVQSWFMRRGDFRTIGVPSQPLAFVLGRWRLPAETGCWLVILLVLVLPVTALIAVTLVPAFGVPLTWASLTFDAYVEVLWRQAVTVRAFQNSGFLAATATVMLVLASVPLAYFIAWRRNRLAGALSTVIDIPYAMPGIVLAIAAILVFLKPIPVIEYSLYGTLWIILVAYLGRFATLAIRPAIAGLTQMDRGLDEAARMTGAGFGFRLRTVIGPLTLPLTAAGGILVFLTAFNELTVSALLWSSGSETLGVVLYNLDESGNHIQAAAIAVAAIVVIIALMFAAHLAGRRLPSGVLPWRD